ncbi:MAG TPA: DUF1993 domain-containing protein [Usitatibacter sp.]|nr:DUF1993 domain-containing protein [Usitatibacter sp.]
MKISMYALSHDVFKKALTQLLTVMEKGVANAKARNFDTGVLVAARLAPDMLPLVAQIQRASDTAKLSAARLAGIEAPRFEDKEASFDELKARIAKTLDFLKTVAPAALDGSEDRDVKFMSSGRERIMKGADHLRFYVLPNFLFHDTTAYNILRHNGVEIGKRDFLNP